MKAILFVLALSFSSPSFALPLQEVATIENADCKVDAQDPNDKGYSLTVNSRLYPKECIDGKRFRPMQNLVIANNTATLNNYLHNNKFWKAQLPIDPSAIENVYFHIMRFPVVEGVTAAHTQIRFIFKDKNAVQLTGTDAAGNVETSSSGDILISFEAAFPSTAGYNFALGAFPNYARFAKIMSTLQKETDSPNGIEQYELKLSAEESATLLSNTLVYAQNIGIEGFYNTLRPNCTTELFDQLDQLPSLKGKAKKFLTMISADPIAGPSLEALKKRDLIVKRVQNFGDELKGIRQTLQVPEAQKSLVTTFLPKMDGRPWTMTTVMPDTSKMSDTEKKALTSVRDELVRAIPTLIQTYGSVMMLAPKESKGQQLFLSTLKEVVSRAPALLRKVNKDLPEELTEISLYFSSYETDIVATDLSAFGVPAEIPIALNKFQVDNSTKQSRQLTNDLYDNVAYGIMQIPLAGNANKDSKAYLMAASIQVHAQKDNSKVATQIMAGLAPMESALVSESPQVKIQKIVIPEHSGFINQPAMIITHFQEVNEVDVNPLVNIQFGSFGGLGDNKSEFGANTLLIQKGAVFCNGQAASTPYFQGQINDKFTNSFVDPVLKGGPIAFHLMSMNMNLKTMKVTNMDLKIEALWFLSCLTVDDANKQFTENANKAITEMLEKTSNADVLQMLAPLLN